jgi:hypothetical protein
VSRFRIAESTRIEVKAGRRQRSASTLGARPRTRRPAIAGSRLISLGSGSAASCWWHVSLSALIVQFTATAPWALPAAALHAIGLADLRRGVHCWGSVPVAETGGG